MNQGSSLVFRESMDSSATSNKDKGSENGRLWELQQKKSRRSRIKDSELSVVDAGGTGSTAERSVTSEDAAIISPRCVSRLLGPEDSGSSHSEESDSESQFPGAIRVGGRSGAEESLHGDTLRVGSEHNPRPPDVLSSLQNSATTTSTTVVAHLAPDIEEELERRIEQINRSKNSTSTAVIAEVMGPLAEAEASTASDDDDSKCYGFSQKSLLSCAVLVLVLVVAVLVIVMTLPGGVNDPDTTQLQNDNLVPSSAPFQMPSDQPSRSGFGDGSEETSFSSRFESLYDLISSDVAEMPEILRDVNTPQFSTLSWMADVDESNLTSSSDVILKQVSIERYVIILLFYTTGGLSWNRNLDFLTSSSVCDWNDRHQFGCLDLGVECFEGPFATTIRLGTCLLPFLGLSQT